MFIQVLGTGCAKCTKLAVQAEKAITEVGQQCLEHWNSTLQNYHKAVGSLLKATQKAVRT